VPRSKPVSRREIKAREEEFFGLGRVAASPKRLKGDKSEPSDESGLGLGAALPSRLNRKQLPSWDFSEPIKILRIKDEKSRHRCQKELTLVVSIYFLEQFSEKQETPDRKACSLKREKQWRKRRQHHLAELEQALRTKDGNLANTLIRRLWSVQLPQALEQEVHRSKATNSLEQRVATLREKYEKAASGHGRIRSYALTHLVQRLQLLASEHRQCLTWRGRNIPPELIGFIRATLDAAEIRAAGYDNPSKLRKHMIKPPKNGNCEVKPTY
jgi:hypothetical protein